MTSNVIISCNVSTSDPDAALGFEAWIDNHKFFDSEHVQADQQLSVEIADDQCEHELKFINHKFIRIEIFSRKVNNGSRAEFDIFRTHRKYKIY